MFQLVKWDIYILTDCAWLEVKKAWMMEAEGRLKL